MLTMLQEDRRDQYRDCMKVGEENTLESAREKKYVYMEDNRKGSTAGGLGFHRGCVRVRDSPCGPSYWILPTFIIPKKDMRI